MKIMFGIWCIVISILLGIAVYKYFPKEYGLRVVSPMPKKNVLQKQNTKSEEISLFIPYWSISSKAIETSHYTHVIYFGIVPNASGIDTTGDGYKNITSFLSRINPHANTLLTVQMTDTQLNTKVLQDVYLQEKIINQSLTIARQNGFNGIVLDFEISALPFASVTDTITNFTTQFSKETHENKLQFFITMYGDSFYRLRPYNVADIASRADGIMVMAYDLHKAKGDPGGNFPLAMNKNEDYDFKTMIRDFQKTVSAKKLTVIFGMFGYDWKVNENGQSITQAQSLSLNEIKQKFLDHCQFTDCKIKRDTISSEMEITYTDLDKTLHKVWFEDMDSVEKKKEFLQSNGIYATSFWAYSYF